MTILPALERLTEGLKVWILLSNLVMSCLWILKMNWGYSSVWRRPYFQSPVVPNKELSCQVLYEVCGFNHMWFFLLSFFIDLQSFQLCLFASLFPPLIWCGTFIKNHLRGWKCRYRDNTCLTFLSSEFSLQNQKKINWEFPCTHSYKHATYTQIIPNNLSFYKKYTRNISSFLVCFGRIFL